MYYIQNFIKKIICRPECIGILGIVLVIIGTFVPIIYIANMPMSYIQGDGKFLILAMVIVGFLMYRRKAIASLVPTILSCGLMIRYVYMTAPAKVNEQLSVLEVVNNGPGIYLIITGLCLCLAYGILGSNKQKEKKKVDFNIKYFLIGLILPIIGLYLWLINRIKNAEKATNSLRGSLYGIVIFLAICLVYSL